MAMKNARRADTAAADRSDLVQVDDAGAERQRLAARLAEAETRLHDFLEVASDWVWETDQELRFTFLAGRLAELTGFPPEHFIGKTRSDLMRDTTSPEARKHLAELASQRPFRDFVYRLESPLGTRALKISGKPIFDAEGRFRGYRGTGSDVTREFEATQRLEQIYRRFADAIEAIPASLLLTDAEDRVVICNSVTARFLPYAMHLLTPGTPFVEIQRAHAASGIVPDAVGREEEWVQERMAQHRNPQGTLTRPWTDGRYMQIIERRTSEGGVIGIRMDVTELKQREKELEQARTQLREAIESISDGFSIYDADDRLVLCNSKTKEYFAAVADRFVPGTSFEEIIRTGVERGLYKEAEGRIEAFVAERLAIHRSPGRVIEQQLGDGRWLRISERRTRDGGTVGIRVDITELKQREQELEHARAHLREAIEAMPASFILYDADGRLVLCNSLAKEYLPEIAERLVPGASAEELTRERYRRTRADASPAEIEALVAKRMALFRNPGERLTERHPDGRWTQAFEHRMPDGGVVCIRVDLTELKQKEETLAKQAEELRRSNAELEQFAYVASHDLQEPLRMIGSYCQLLQRRYKGKLDADADEFIAYAVEGAKRMQRMINDLLTYSRVGRKGRGKVPVPCNDAVSMALQNLRIAVEESGAKVQVDPLPTIQGERGQLVQLFQNLIGNAIKFHGEAPPEVRVSVDQDGDGWRFTVTDNGIGIENQYLDKIFLIFQRLNERTKYAGTGIGLAICKKVVEHHGGRIWVESEPGQGSRFIFHLPTSGQRGEDSDD
jgi:PAS domain S-box-containing protein